MGIFNVFKKREKSLSTVDNRGGWHTIFEPFAGAWQKNIKLDRDSVLKNKTVFSCISLISGDISKLSIRQQRKSGNIWNDTVSYQVLKRPNQYQTISQFIECWVISKITHGNTYVLKVGDGRKVQSMYILDPRRVTPLVSDDGSVYYQLGGDNLSNLQTSITVPASEIIHDRFNCLFHPLVGLSPLFASSVVAAQGNNIQDNSALFFGNMSRPSGILSAPGAIPSDTAKELKEQWESNYSGVNVGKVAVLGDNLKYQPIAVSALDSQLIEQLKYSDEAICSAFQVPPYKVGIGTMPTYNNISALNLEYYSTCLQKHVQAIEELLGVGLGLSDKERINLDENDLIRMDKATLYDSNNKAVGGGWMKPNEAREKINLPPVDGGDTCYLQQQNYSLSALDKRDQQAPLSSTSTNPPIVEETDDEDKFLDVANLIFKGLLEENDGKVCKDA